MTEEEINIGIRWGIRIFDLEKVLDFELKSGIILHFYYEVTKMLIFLSDLHLAESHKRSPNNLSKLLNRLKELVKRSTDHQIKDLSIVLLGDIFELLRSKEWLDSSLRPWEKCTPKHVTTVSNIFDSIVATNKEFIKGLKSLSEAFPSIKFEYVPGNHDRVLNTDMGVNARSKFQEMLPLRQKGGQWFENVLMDKEHEVIAKHGHDWDPINRYGSKRPAIGDAVVIDILLLLPQLVSKELGILENDSMLDFIYEVDNVRPQVPRVMAKWLIQGLDQIKEANQDADKAIKKSFSCLASEFKTLMKTTKFEPRSTASWWMSFISKIGRLWIRRFGILKIAVRLPWGAGKGYSPYQYLALQDIRPEIAKGGRYRYIVCGHTHIHELVPLDIEIEGSPIPLYINTGTWRRTHCIAEVPREGRIASFSSWQEECLVCIYKPSEYDLGFPPYEINRFTWGNL